MHLYIYQLDFVLAWNYDFIDGSFWIVIDQVEFREKNSANLEHRSEFVQTIERLMKIEIKGLGIWFGWRIRKK